MLEFIREGRERGGRFFSRANEGTYSGSARPVCVTYILQKRPRPTAFNDERYDGRRLARRRGALVLRDFIAGWKRAVRTRLRRVDESTDPVRARETDFSPQLSSLSERRSMRHMSWDGVARVRRRGGRARPRHLRRHQLPPYPAGRRASSPLEADLARRPASYPLAADPAWRRLSSPSAAATANISIVLILLHAWYATPAAEASPMPGVARRRQRLPLCLGTPLLRRWIRPCVVLAGLIYPKSISEEASPTPPAIGHSSSSELQLLSHEVELHFLIS